MLLSDLVPHALGDRPKRLELCDLMEHNPEPIVYTLVISRKIMTASVLGIPSAINTTPSKVFY
jgi:hypothetical protein